MELFPLDYNKENRQTSLDKEALQFDIIPSSNYNIFTELKQHFSKKILQN